MTDPQIVLSNVRSTAAAAVTQAIGQYSSSLLPYFHRSYFGEPRILQTSLQSVLVVIWISI